MSDKKPNHLLSTSLSLRRPPSPGAHSAADSRHSPHVTSTLPANNNERACV